MSDRPTLKEVLKRLKESSDTGTLTTDDIVSAFEVTETTVYRWVAAGHFTAQPTRTRGAASVYKLGEVERWARVRYGAEVA